jgi:peptide/nickel transport system permease protein
MLRYIAKRVLFAIPTLFLVAIGVFLLVRLIPGDPALVMLGEGADPAAIAAIHAKLGLDQPLPVQFVAWLGRVFHGDLGNSIISDEPVGALILSRFQLTASIVIVAVAFATCIAISAGLAAAWKRHRRLDSTISTIASLMLSIPTFWMGLVLLLIFGVWLKWLPVVGYVSVAEGGLSALAFLVLPIVTLTIAESGGLIRMMRASTIDVLSLDYITHARAKGLSERAVLLRHAFPNAFAPTLTLVGLSLGHLLGGAAVTETVFTLPGLGRLMVNAVLARDYPVIQGCLLFTATVYVVVNLVIELLYPLFDPRVTAQ